MLFRIKPAPLALALVLACTAGTTASTRAAVHSDELVALGRTLFFDTALSRDRSMSCASCHDPGAAFTDPRDNGVAGAASIGNDGKTLGDRNAPSLTYVSLVPAFRSRGDGGFEGGLFHDGRAGTLRDQASQPIVSPREMGLASAATVLDRLREKPAYIEALSELAGAPAQLTPDAALDAVATAIAAYEQSAEFATFDSKYDRYLRGEASLTHEEELGRILFFSPLSNCNHCHLLDRREDQAGETFTSYAYHNIGVPVNARVRAANGSGRDYVDPGLAANPHADASGRGKYRVPSLRNVAVTAPYMHNGVFAELRTAIVFYNRFLVDNPASRTNPETGVAWGAPEVPATVDLELLGKGQPLTEQRVAQLEAFLRTLTDRRYEHLLER